MSNKETMQSIVAATEDRRAPMMYANEQWFIHEFKIHKFRSPWILPWIARHTTGRFWLSPGAVAFDNKDDLLVFRLSYSD